ncbi:TylF/MycF/NovP-related O-methyltransferase [Pseudomarimonas salicorniae]|uniref:TylF/MycF family methyltransferase n=1 Tax=Pseudomarimonas salicorniae TaxID=2933270 RepID=A0ABT0GFM0_9GAMM|nr:TylF/MycF/NovP-related O-methyltransferase [Lysobacter sp. CAU 1642]MCK7593333.1 TylF/MycF family methyltransferase [Lysobacter sp. CAU 1642]
MPHTMGGVERTLATIASVQYVVEQGIEGAIVECGVWRGGQMMAAALTLSSLGQERDLYLFDTFSGMTAPDQRDRDFSGAEASGVYDASLTRAVGDRWCEAGSDLVRRNLHSTGYPPGRFHLVQGDVCETLPQQAPGAISYLRLDTDWYRSTAHELRHLYPRVSPFGLVTIDDYGHWQGARQATDEFIKEHSLKVFLHRIDYSARQFVKT